MVVLVNPLTDDGLADLIPVCEWEETGFDVHDNVVPRGGSGSGHGFRFMGIFCDNSEKFQQELSDEEQGSRNRTS